MRLVAAALLLVALWAVPAAAGESDAVGAVATAEKSGDGIGLGIVAAADGSPTRVGANPLAGCVIVSGLSGADAIDYAGGTGIAIGITNPAMSDPEDTTTYVFISCPTRIFSGFAWAVWEEGEPPPPFVIDALAAAARANIVIPALTPESAPDGLDTPFLTQLPVWLWVPAESWVPLTGSASIPELGLTITATATPVNTNWITGPGPDDTFTCEAGTPWEPGLDDDATDCSATFGDTTPADTTVDLTVTTNYNIGFTCTPGLCNPANIDLDGFNVTVARPVTVTEARGVISR